MSKSNKAKKKSLIDILQDDKNDLRPLTNNDGSLCSDEIFYDNNRGDYYYVKSGKVLKALLKEVFECGEAKAKNDLRKLLGV